MEEKIKVLIVDDNPVNLLAAKNILSQFPIEVEEASSGMEALQYVKKNSVDLIIMDLIMPGLTGMETTKMMRNQIINGNQIKVIATSGQKIESLTSFLKEYLLDDFLVKPLDIDRVERCLMQWFFIARVPHSELKSHEHSNQWNKIDLYFKPIKQMNLRQAYNLSGGNADYFLRVVLSSVTQLKEAEIAFHSSLSEFTAQKAHQLLHSLKSVLYYLCAATLVSKAERLDEAFQKEKEKPSNYNSYIQILQELQLFTQDIETFTNELEQAINAYNNSINKNQNLDKKQSYSRKEISNYIENLLSCVCRFEYIEILKGLNQLTEMLQEQYKEQIEVAMVAMDEFDYETVKNILVSCWNELNEM